MIRDSQRGGDLLAFALDDEEIQVPVLSPGDQCRRDLVQGVPQAELLVAMEQIAGSALPLPDFGKDRFEGSPPPRIVVKTGHRKPIDFGMIPWMEGPSLENDVLFDVSDDLFGVV